MELRCYTIVNQYISGIHAGIQSAHAIAELFEKYTTYPCVGNADALLNLWNSQYKTIIVLEGGHQSNLEKIYTIFKENSATLLPFAKFHETQDALNGALTALSIVLPEYIYGATYCEGGYWEWWDSCKLEWHRLKEYEVKIKEAIKDLRLKGT